MNATTAFLCITIVSLVSIIAPVQANSPEEGTASSGSREAGRPAMPRKADPHVPEAAPSPARPKQLPAPPDRNQVVEERLRSGQMEKPIAQGEVSDRLNQLYSGSNGPVQ